MIGLIIGLVYLIGWLATVPFAWRLLRDIDRELKFGEFAALGSASLLASLFWPLVVGLGGPAWLAYQVYLRFERNRTRDH